MRPLPVIMEPSPWEQNDEPDSGSNLLIDGQTAQISTGFGNQVIMLQQPSSAAKVIGILLIIWGGLNAVFLLLAICLLYTSPSPRDERLSRMPSSA